MPTIVYEMNPYFDITVEIISEIFINLCENVIGKW